MKQKASTDMEAQKPEEAKKPKGTRKSNAAESPKEAESAKAAEEPKEEESPKTTRKPRATRKSNAAESPKEAESAKTAEEPKEEESPKTTRKPRATRKAKTSESTKEPESVKEPESTKEVEDTKAAESPKEAEKPVKKPRTARATKAKKEQDVVEATPVKPARRRIAKAEKIDYVEYEPTAKPIEVAEEPKEESDGLEDAMEKLERITKSSPFAKYDAMLEDDDDDDDDEPKVVVPRPAARVSPVATTSTRAPRGKSRKRDGDEEFLIPDDSAKIAALNKGNAWSYEVEQIYEMLLEGRHTEHWAENEVHFMNIIKPVFDVKFVDRTDENLIATLEEQGFYVNVYPKSRDDMNNAIALRKHQIRKITDLTMENILHLTPREVLDLIEENMGTGWQGLPLPIQDIIETGFYVDSTVMPAAAMHRAGGIIDRRKADGYEVLEVERGTWIEGIFLKYKPRQEKRHFEAISDINRRQYDDGDDENDDDDDDDDLIDENDDDDELDDDDDQMEEQDPQYEEFEDIPVEDDEE